jgi:methionine sulfoxide reductase heme-binding subunit
MEVFTTSLAALAGAPLALAAASAHSAAAANPLLWYVTRAAAVSSYVVLSLTVMLGMVRSLTRVGRMRVSWLLDETHQFLALLTVALVALHLLSLVFDPLVPFTPLNLLLPVAEPYRPFAVDLGVLALYALGIVALSSWLRRYIAYASWRTLHAVSFVAFFLVTLHGVFAGSDAGAPWMRLIYLAATGVVMLLAFVRLFWAPAGQRAQRGLS